MLIESVGAILLISPEPKALRDFYADTLGLPLVDEIHEGVPLHYGCELGDVHFAIHPARGWPGAATKDAQSPVIAFNTSDAEVLADRVRKAGIEASGPHDHGFAQVVSFRDPDGNLVEALEAKVQ